MIQCFLPAPRCRAGCEGRKLCALEEARETCQSPLPFATLRITGLSSPPWCCCITGFCDVADGPERSSLCLAASSLSGGTRHLRCIMCSISFAAAQTLVVARGLSCPTLVPQTGLEPVSPPRQILYPWATREVPRAQLLS